MSEEEEKSEESAETPTLDEPPKLPDAPENEGAPAPEETSDPDAPPTLDDTPESQEADAENQAPKNPYDPDFDDFDEPDIEYVDEPRNVISRGDEVNITEKDPTMQEIMVGVGWDLKKFDSTPLDLDASLFLLDRNNKTREDEDFVFYNNLAGCDGAVKHLGDSRTGAGDGDDENLQINLLSLPFDVSKISFVLSIYDLDGQDHDFSMVKNVYFRIVNQNTQHELFRYELDEELVGNEGLIIGELERLGSEWVFRAVGECVKGGLGKIAQDFGIVVLQIVQD